MRAPFGRIPPSRLAVSLLSIGSRTRNYYHPLYHPSTVRSSLPSIGVGHPRNGSILSGRPSLALHTSTGSNTNTASATNSTNSMSALWPPMIDVDCNLWHRDLTTLQDTSATPDGIVPTNKDPWNILREDALGVANIVAMVSPSSTLREAKMGLAHLQSHPSPIPVRTTVGVHPYHVNDDELVGSSMEEHSDVMIQLLTSPETAQHCVAVGECGLDTSDGFPPIQNQIPWFQMQIQVAQTLQLPLFIHERHAFDQTMDLLNGVTVPILIHCFTGTKEECRAYVRRGYYISISGYILRESSGGANNSNNDDDDHSVDVISCLQEGIIPLDRLMIETDAPYMGFPGCRKLYLEWNQEYLAGLNSKRRKRLQQSTYPNVPTSLPMVLSKVTECLQHHDPTLTLETVAAATTANARSFFGF